MCALLVASVAGWRWWSGHATQLVAAQAPGGSLAAGSLGTSAGASTGASVGASAAIPVSALSAGSPALVTLAAPQPDPALGALVMRLVDEDNGDTAVVVRNLRTGAGAAYRDRDVFPSASLAKVPILVEVYRLLETGKLAPDTPITVTADDITDGAGVLQASEGERLSVAELLDLAVRVSDNTAARMLLRVAGGESAINRTMADLGAAQTRLYADSRPNTTSAADMAALLAMLASRGPASSPAPNTLTSLLALPQAQAWLSQGIPSGVVVSHKSGQLPGVRHDAAVVYAPHGPYVVVGLTRNLADQDAAEDFLATLAHQTYDYFAK